MRAPRCSGSHARAAVLSPLLWFALACPGATPGDRVAPTQAVGWSSDRLHAVLVNGGGRRQINYYSHLDHLRGLLRLLEATGLGPEQIAVFSGDGADPAVDLATREGELPPDFWLLPRSVGRALRPPIEYVDSRIEGFVLRPATRQELRSWFVSEGSQLASGDTLLFYVTDHGEKNPEDLTDNTITLWGEKLSVSELRGLLALLDPGVRVLMLMSQCYSGAFVNAIFPDGVESLPAGSVCGYFSATAERRAHGCYPEVSGKEAIGHSHRLFAALGAGHRLANAHREVLVTDGTPDVPHASSSFFLEKQLQHAAAGSGRAFPDFVDERLAQALRDPLAWEPEIRLLDRVGQAFGFASPRSLAGLEEQAQGLSELSERLATYAKRWEGTLDALRQENLGAFQAAHPEWRARLQPAALKGLDADARRWQREELLDALVRFTGQAREREDRLRDLHWKTQEAKAARYRAEVRLGVLLRMRTLLAEVAGRHYLTRDAPDAVRDSFARLRACEDLALAAPADAVRTSRPPEPFPTLSEERRRLEDVMPGWLGIRYRRPRPGERRRHDLQAGSAVVSAILPDSPAADAGMQVNDILLGPPGEPFMERHAVREWTMQGQIGAWRPLRLLRNGEELELMIRLAAYPLELPKLPGPLEIGSPAPPLELELLWDARPPEPQRSRLLFFWATWCSFCKKALPEVLAFARERNVPLVAITDEDPEDVETFFRNHLGPLPELVAIDRRRIHFEQYGVSGTPTLVLVDERGIVRHYQTGYNAAQGLGIEGWQWQGRAATD